MTRKKPMWSQLQQEKERRERLARAQERMQYQMTRQLQRDYERSVRDAARADAAERKRQEPAAHEVGASAAKALKRT